MPSGPYWTPARDAELTRLRRKGMTARGIGELMGVSESAIYKRANRIGLGVQKRWSEKDDERLVDLIAEHPPKQVARMMGRTLDAIHNRVSRLRQSTLERGEWFSVQDLQFMLGVGEQFIWTRIKTGAIEAQDHWENGHYYKVTRAALRKYLRRYATELEGKKIDIVLLIDVLAGITPEASHGAAGQESGLSIAQGSMLPLARELEAAIG